MMHDKTVRLCIFVGSQTSIGSDNTNYFQQARIWKNAKVIKVNQTVATTRKETICTKQINVPFYIKL